MTPGSVRRRSIGGPGLCCAEGDDRPHRGRRREELSRNHLLAAILAPLDEFVGDHCKPAELRRTECRRNSHIRCVPAARDHDASNPRMIVTRIEGEPAAVEKYLEPCAEIHRRGIAGHADIAEITGTVARRDVHAPTKRHRQMREVTAYANAFVMAFRSRTIAARMVIAEFEALMHVVADRLDTLPAAGNASEQGPGEIRKSLGIAIAASNQVDQRLVRQYIDAPLLRIWRDLIGQAAVFDDEFVLISIRPGGATSRVQILPKASR